MSTIMEVVDAEEKERPTMRTEFRREAEEPSCVLQVS